MQLETALGDPLEDEDLCVGAKVLRKCKGQSYEVEILDISCTYIRSSYLATKSEHCMVLLNVYQESLSVCLFVEASVCVAPNKYEKPQPTMPPAKKYAEDSSDSDDGDDDSEEKRKHLAEMS